MEQCLNCQREIAVDIMMLHQAYCERFLIRCDICSDIYDQNEKDEHMEQHQKVPCNYCKNEFQKTSVDKHISETCEQRPQVCVYCKLQVPSNVYIKHTEQCGSRTEKCSICQQFVKLSFMEEHQQICQFQFEEPFLENIVKLKKNKQPVVKQSKEIWSILSSESEEEIHKVENESDESFIVEDDVELVYKKKPNQITTRRTGQQEKRQLYKDAQLEKLTQDKKKQDDPSKRIETIQNEEKSDFQSVQTQNIVDEIQNNGLKKRKDKKR